MADALKIQVDQASLAKFEATFTALPEKMNEAERDALNRGMAHGKTVAATDLAKEMGASQASIKKRLNIVKATKGNLSVAMYIRGGRGVNLAGFRARQTSSGVSARIEGQNQTFPGAFLTRALAGTKFNFGATGQKIVGSRTDDSGNPSVKRAMAAGRYAGRTIKRGPRAGQPLLRQPIRSLKGPTVAEEWAKTPGIAEHTTNAINEDIPKNLEQQIKRFGLS